MLALSYCLIVSVCATAGGGVPVVSNLRALQHAGTQVVGITYDVVAPDSVLVNVSVAVSSNGGTSYDLPTTHFSGDGFGSAVIPGENRYIAWDAGADWSNQYSREICVQLTVSDGSLSPFPVDMVLIPEGAFTMGDTIGDGSLNERPVHTVAVSAVYLDAYEVTNEKMRETMQWALDQVPPLIVATSSGVSNLVGEAQLLLDLSRMGRSQISYSAGVFSVDRGKESFPCVEVTWFGAAAFCNYRSLMVDLKPCYSLTDWSCDWTAKGYRLPTEAEWEKAARGGLGNQRFPSGMIISHAQANYMGYSAAFPYDQSDGSHPDFRDSAPPRTGPVGAFPANGYGVYDMAGNVYEWCADWYADDYYSVSPEVDPKGATSGVHRSERGGFWGSSAHFCRNAYRNSNNPDFCNGSIGFRIVRTPGDVHPVQIASSPIWVDTTSDTDGDGFTDGEEALAGTNPYERDDFLQILNLELNRASAWHCRVDWPAKSGKTYQVLVSTNILGVWTPAFSGVEPEQQSEQTAPSDAILRYYDMSAPAVLNRFYRLQLIP